MSLQITGPCEKLGILLEGNGIELLKKMQGGKYTIPRTHEIG